MVTERPLKKARTAQDQRGAALTSPNSITADVNPTGDNIEIESHLAEDGVSIAIERPAVKKTRNTHKNAPPPPPLTTGWRPKRIRIVEKPQSTTSEPTDDVSHNLSRNSLRDNKLDKTNLYVTSSTKAYGGVTIKLSSCQNIDDFFSSVLAAWSLEGKALEVEAIVVQFNWPGPRPMVIRQKLPDSFRVLVEVIEKAPCWKEGGDEQTCEVDVKILMAWAKTMR